MISHPKSEGTLWFSAFPSNTGAQKVLAGFTTRQVGNGVDPLAPFLGVERRAVVSLKQVHSNRVITVDQIPEADEFSVVEGDGLITQTPGVILALKTADCAPVLLYDSKNGAIAALHAGFRGLLSGIIEAGVCELKAQFHSSPEDIFAAIGPSICQECFEVGPEVADLFRARFGEGDILKNGRDDRAHANLRLGCEKALIESGLKREAIFTSPFCTACRTDLFFSYRREGPETGRLASFIAVPVSPPR